MKLSDKAKKFAACVPIKPLNEKQWIVLIYPYDEGEKIRYRQYIDKNGIQEWVDEDIVCNNGKVITLKGQLRKDVCPFNSEKEAKDYLTNL